MGQLQRHLAVNIDVARGVQIFIAKMSILHTTKVLCTVETKQNFISSESTSLYYIILLG